MSKYDFEIDTSNNSSTGIILNRIEKGSVVLEFGCATGRMTRYMKEVLGCRVYIVEYEESAYKEALQYAEDGVCGDIQDYAWVEKFKDIAFDAIIFADVLEHLKTPEKVLAEASKYLKDTGAIHVSIPNITHNDVFLKAFDERFDYTAVGILDDTHVHFWGFNNLEMLAKNSGLGLRSVTGTFCPTGYTEQYEGENVPGDTLLLNMLKERVGGEVYQFVLSLDKNYQGQPEYIFRTPTINSHIYLDTGIGFNGEEMITFESAYCEKGRYHAHYTLENVAGVQNVRFDPIEFQGCVLENLVISQGTQELPLVHHNGLELEKGLLMPGEDPMLWVKVLTDEPVVIRADIIIRSEAYIQRAEAAVENKCLELQKCQGQVAGLQENILCLTREKQSVQEENVQIQSNLDRMTGEKEATQRMLDQVNGEKAETQRQLERVISEKDDIQRDLGAYIILANNKDKYALSLRNELQNRERYIQELDTALQERGRYIQELDAALRERVHYIQELDAALNYYKSMRVVKIRVFLARVIKGVLRRVKRVVNKVLGRG